VTTESARPRPICGRISAVFAVLAAFSPLVVGFLFVGAEQVRPPAPETGPEAQREAWGWLGRVLMGFIAAIVAAGISALAGAFAGIASIGRGERPIWPAWLGLSVCGTILILLLGAYLNGQQ
jgi:uncharacterized membrane protein